MSITPTYEFYESLPVFDQFAGITEEGQYRPLPDDWHVVVSDIEGSTAAIARGGYKHVNIVGAASIVAVLNAVRPRKVPFVFGGDGAVLAVPEADLQPVREALITTKRMALREFGLTLRVGVVPVRELHAAGHRALVARFRVSPYYTQAVFSGGGVAAAEAWVKDADRGRGYQVPEEEVGLVEPFDGLECRWDDIPSPHGETITLVVRALDRDVERRALVYREVIERINGIYGDLDDCRPVRLDVMRLAHSDRKLSAEVRVRTSGQGRLRRLAYWVRLKLQMAVGYAVFPRGGRFSGVDWGEYQRDVVSNTDCRKFDDVLRQVLSGRPEQRQALSRFLEEMHLAGELVYGIHAASAALMTCLVFNRQGEHVHFVDGAEGGYALAAQQMKAQLAAGEGKRSTRRHGDTEGNEGDL
jgi:hypothetical protein